MANDHLVASYVRFLAAVPPGLWQVEVDAGWGGQYRAPGAELAFTDRAGVHWVRRSDGRLEELEAEAPTHYGLPRPFSMTAPSPFDANR